jgi:hypothetical protein
MAHRDEGRPPVAAISPGRLTVVSRTGHTVPLPDSGIRTGYPMEPGLWKQISAR